MTTPTTPTPQATPEPVEQEPELWMLAGLALVIHWFEELLSLVNGPMLLFGLGIALVDLLTDGRLTTDMPWLLIAWGVSQALGIDTQLLGCWSRVRKAWERGRYKQVTAWAVLGIIIGYAAWQAGDVYAVQQSQHLSEAAALAQLGMSAEAWFGWRAFLAVGLVALAGVTRYQKPRKVKAKTDLVYERDELTAQLELEPLRQRLAAQRAAGVGMRMHSALDGVRGAEVSFASPDRSSRIPPTLPPLPMKGEGPRRPPTGPGSPVAAPSSDDAMNGAETQTGTGPMRLVGVPVRQHRKPAAMRERDRAALAALDERRRAFVSDYLDTHDDVTPNQLRAALKDANLGSVGWKLANRMIEVWKRDQTRQSLAQ